MKKIRIIEGSKLNKDEEFLRFIPETQEQRHLRGAIISLIESNQTYDFTIMKEIIPLEVGKTPKDIEKSISQKIPKGHMMTYKEFIMYKAEKIKQLITNYDYRVEEAWRQVCDYSGISQPKKLIKNDIQGGFLKVGIEKCSDYTNMYNDLILSKIKADEQFFEKLEVWVTVPNKKAQI